MGAILAALIPLALSLGRIVIGIVLYAAPLPLRDSPRVRIPLALLALFAIYLGLSFLTMRNVSGRSGLGFSIAQFVTYSLLLIASVGAAHQVWDTTIWTALFCCSAGYTVQNLASGATELVWFLVGGGGPDTGAYSSPERLLVSLACTLAVYLPTFIVVTRPLLRNGLTVARDRSLIAAMALVILGIIGFDLVIKWLTETGVAVAAMVLLRLFHGMFCIFLLVIEFESLVVKYLQGERETLEKVLAEHERQYEQSRETVAAVNARMHDIRHSIARLADNAHVEHGVLREMVHEVSVYDAKVHTGNEALDTALTEKRLMLEHAGVSLSCVADGSSLSFMAPADIYTLFSTMLDSGVSQGATTISLVVREALGTASIHIESNCTALDESLLIRAAEIVRRYGGTFSASRQDGSSHINALFPEQ